MLNGIIDSQKVRAQKAVASLQSSGSSFVPRHSEYQLKIKMLKESLRQRDEEMRQQDEAMRKQDEFYAKAFAQQQTILQVSSLNYFIHYRALSNNFKTNSLHDNMYSKWCSSKDFKCCSSSLPYHYLTSGHLLELMYVSYHFSLSDPSF
jgi:hypothetical protein